MILLLPLAFYGAAVAVAVAVVVATATVFSSFWNKISEKQQCSKKPEEGNEGSSRVADAVVVAGAEG